MSITFTLVAASTTTTVTPISGTVTYGGNHDLRGGRVTEAVVAANARTGSCQCIIDTTHVESTIIGLVSAAGAGDYTVAGSDVTGYEAYEALVDVNYGEGEAGVQVATITWKGTVATA